MVKVTQQIKGISFKNNKKGEHIFFKTYFPICAFLCNFEQSDENNFSYQYIAFAIEGGSSWKNTPYHWFLDKKWGNMNFYFIWATPILLNISRESFFILFTYAQKPIPNAQIDNEVFRSGAPLYIVSVTVVRWALPFAEAYCACAWWYV